MRKQVMKRAWELAYEGATKFGGSPKEYLAISLSVAWKECKGVEQNEIELIGSEKQVKWARDIIARIEAAQSKMKEVAKQCGFKPSATSEGYMQEALDFIDNLTKFAFFENKAAVYIDYYSWVKTEEDVHDLLSTRGLLKYDKVKEMISRRGLAILQKTHFTLDKMRYEED